MFAIEITYALFGVEGDKFRLDGVKRGRERG